MAHRTDRGQGRRDRLGRREVEHQARGPAAQGRDGRVDGLRGLAGQDDLATGPDVMLRDLEPDRACPADDDDRSLITHPSLLQRPAVAGSAGIVWPVQASTPRSATAAHDGSQRRRTAPAVGAPASRSSGHDPAPRSRTRGCCPRSSRRRRPTRLRCWPPPSRQARRPDAPVRRPLRRHAAPGGGPRARGGRGREAAGRDTALVVYCGISVKMLVDRVFGADLLTMFTVDYELGGAPRRTTIRSRRRTSSWPARSRPSSTDGGHAPAR